MLFADLQFRLIHRIRSRIRAGEMSERALARRVGLSQSHLNNVLKGARILTAEVADLLLREFGWSVRDLIDEAPRKGPAAETAPYPGERTASR